MFLTSGTICSHNPAMSTFPILDKLGGRVAVIAELGVTRDQVRMWETRARIPGDAQVALMRMAERKGIPFSAADFDAAEPCRESATSYP
jgi:hypothetical protein